MPMSQEAWKVVAAFQRFVNDNDKAGIETFTLGELQHADQQLGNKDENANFRLAIQNRIADLHRTNQRKHESRIRAWQIIVRIIVSLVIAGLIKLVFGT